jgi:hypothetical protein
MRLYVLVVASLLRGKLTPTSPPHLRHSLRSSTRPELASASASGIPQSASLSLSSGCNTGLLIDTGLYHVNGWAPSKGLVDVDLQRPKRAFEKALAMKERLQTSVAAVMTCQSQSICIVFPHPHPHPHPHSGGPHGGSHGGGSHGAGQRISHEAVVFDSHSRRHDGEMVGASILIFDDIDVLCEVYLQKVGMSGSTVVEVHSSV